MLRAQGIKLRVSRRALSRSVPSLEEAIEVQLLQTRKRLVLLLGPLKAIPESSTNDTAPLFDSTRTFRAQNTVDNNDDANDDYAGVDSDANNQDLPQLTPLLFHFTAHERILASWRRFPDPLAYPTTDLTLGDIE
ncbi:hypothetical protein FRB97_000764 [Tulasnella sp. 331]|nr:hypothetical protein FRB97_000764 [Tulasnella sp. 331]KAG8886934.1 hypothetical protein FRB98_000762 [Tulasnella sp. 332]